MALYTQTQEIAVYADPLSYNAELKVLAGNPVQTFNKESGKFEPDRLMEKEANLTLLAPIVSVSDPEALQSGPQEILGCTWYEGSPSRGKRITSGKDYHINHPSIEGYNPKWPTWALEVTKNFDPDSPCEICAVFTFLDKRKAVDIKVERSILFRCSYYDYEALGLQLWETPTHQRVDPLLVIPNSKGQWLYSLKAQLYSGKSPVPDEKAAYWWQIQDGESWRDFSADELAVFVSGDKTKSLQIDARYIRQCNVRCIAERNDGERPARPKSTEFQVTASLKVEFNRTLHAEMRQSAGVRISPNMKNRCEFIIDLYDNRQIVGDDKNGLFSIGWTITSQRPGANPIHLDGGRRMSFIPAEQGLDLVYPSVVSSAVKMYAVGALLTIGGKALKFGNSYLTTPKYE